MNDPFSGRVKKLFSFQKFNVGPPKSIAAILPVVGVLMFPPVKVDVHTTQIPND